MSRESHVAAVLSMMANWDLSTVLDRLHRTPADVLLVTAPGDRAVPPDQAQEVQGLLPSLRIVSLPQGGHLVHEELPASIDRLIDHGQVP